MDRRTTIKWMLAASASVPFLDRLAFAAPQGGAAARLPAATPYGSDPKLLDAYKPGELWPLTFTPGQRRTATALSDLIIPADDTSPSASAVGVVDFIDEWVSAPYPKQRHDRKIVLAGFDWLDRESAKRYALPFAKLEPVRQTAICDDICYVARAKPRFARAAIFFARYRDLTAGGFYTTPQGRRDLQYIGNTPLPRFDGPSPEVLRKVGLA
ncbi:MAG: gluconate 2-dehydrogenase subunit 3 family protein [Rhodospirillaceae bacterium]